MKNPIRIYKRMLTIIRLGVRLLIGGKLILRLLPKTGRPICISIGGSGRFAGENKLVSVSYPRCVHPTITYWQLICLPSLHLLSLLTFKRVRGYWFLLMETFAATRRPPLHHYVFDNVKYSNATHLLSLCLRGMFPLSDP